MADLTEAELKSGLLILADRCEAKATQLRAAAAMLDAEPTTESTLEPTAPTSPARLPGDRADYLNVMVTFPAGFIWNADALARAMEQAGFAVGKEAARTMLYRFEETGVVTKFGRGQWQLPQKAAESSAPRSSLTGTEGPSLQLAPIQGVS